VLLLVVIPLGLLWLFVSVHHGRLGFGNLSVRGALVLAFLAFETLLLAITDLTSIDRHFAAGPVAVAWAIIIILFCDKYTDNVTGAAGAPPEKHSVRPPDLHPASSSERLYRIAVRS
jgi:hypothetical protein